MRTLRVPVILTTILTTVVLLATACGGDDGEFRPGVAGDAGAGSDLPEGLDGLPDNASDLLEDLQDGTLDDSSLEDLMDSAQEMAESFGGSGGGTVEVNGDTIEFSSEICFAGQGDFTIEGLGATGDGTPVWISISHSEDSRAEMAEFLDEDMLEMMYGDADPIIDDSFSAEYGREEMFGSGPDDQPRFDATSFGDSDISIEVDGNAARGSGTATDNNFTSGDFEARYEFSFEAACN